MSTNKTFRDNFLDHVRGLCRFVSFAELRERFPLQFDTALDKLRADSAFEFCELNQPQARALATYSPEAAMYFPAHCYPMVLAYGVAGQSLSASARAAEETKLANLSLSVDARAEALERAQAEAVITVECVRFNFFSFLNEPNAVRRRQLVIPDFMRLMSRRREGFTVADLFLFMGIDVRADAQLLSDLRRRVHYDGRDQTFSVSLLEILIDARKMHWDVLSARVGYEVGDDDRKLLLKNPGVSESKSEKGVLEYTLATGEKVVRYCGSELIRTHTLRHGAMPLDLIEFSHHILLETRELAILHQKQGVSASMKRFPVSLQEVQIDGSPQSRAALKQWPWLLSHFALYADFECQHRIVSIDEAAEHLGVTLTRIHQDEDSILPSARVEPRAFSTSAVVAPAHQIVLPSAITVARYDLTTDEIAEQKEALTLLIRSCGSKGIKFSSINERTLLDLNNRQHLVLLESLKQSSQIRLEHDVFFYVPKIPGVDNAQDLEAFMAQHPFGLLRLDLVDCFLDADLAIDKILSKVPRIAIAIENSDKREQCVYYFKSSQDPAFEADLQTMWAELQLPRDDVDLERELQRFQVHTTSNADPSSNAISRARLPAKRKVGSAGDGNTSSRFKNFRGKITNSHLPQPPQ